LCWLVLVGLVSLGALWFSTALLLGGAAFGQSVPLDWRDVMMLLWPGLLYVVAGAVLHVWRSCDACGFHLYNCFDTRWWPQEVVRWNQAPRLPHVQTERVLNSFSYGVIWSKARRGVAHCPWCGHADRVNDSA
jgi:hypothetical protein